MLYGSECWTVKYQYEVIRNKVEIVSIEEKMRETRLRWFCRVRRRLVDVPMKRVDEIE